MPEYYEFFNPAKVISGYKALENFPFELGRPGAKKPIIITDKGVAQAGLVKHVADSFPGIVIKSGLTVSACAARFSRCHGSRKEHTMKILVYYDGTQYTKEAIPVVKKHAKAFQAAVDVVSSLPRGDDSQKDRIKQMEEDLAALKGSLEREKIPCETHLLIRGNDAGEDVVWFAREHAVDEIIIGTEKKTRLQKFIIGSVAQDVVINASCPVLII